MPTFRTRELTVEATCWLGPQTPHPAVRSEVAEADVLRSDGERRWFVPVGDGRVDLDRGDWIVTAPGLPPAVFPPAEFAALFRPADGPFAGILASVPGVRTQLTPTEVEVLGRIPLHKGYQ